MYEIKILTDQRAVTAAGTPEQIQETGGGVDTKVIAIRVRAKTGNAGDVYVTYEDLRASASTDGDILAPGEVWTLDVSQLGFDAYVDLSRVWIDAANNGDAVSYTAVRVIT